MGSVVKNGRTYEQASKAIQDNLKRHLENNDNLSLSDSDEESEDNTEQIQRLIDGYTRSNSSALDKDFLKNVVDGLKNVLNTSCLICISSVKKNDAIWSCSNCFNSFHINCIQKWAKDSIYQQKVQLEDDPDRVAKEKQILWTCPKCRHGYSPTRIPRDYVCFCGKVDNPAFDPWILPHSCGENCKKPLHPKCGHVCLILCHPGPCPPCPKVKPMYLL